MTGTDVMTKRVLAIDDDETILNVIDNVLKMHDYEAVTATQWVEALDAINERTPDLLLLDLQMPHVDGFFLLEWIREQELKIPVIVVSAYLNEDSKLRLESLGVTAFVLKPFNVKDLVAKIEGIVGKGAGAVDAVPSKKKDEGTDTVLVKALPEKESADTVTLADPSIAAILADPSVGAILSDPSSEESAESNEQDGEPDGSLRRRRRVRRSRRGTSKRMRRRTALYLLLIAVVSVGISSVSIYLRNVAESVEQAVEEEMSTRDGDNELLKELLRAQIETDRISKMNQPPKTLDLKLPRKQK